VSDVLEELGTASTEWSELARRVGNIFGTPEWHEVWWAHFGQGHRRFVAGLRDSGTGALRLALPLYEWRSRPLSISRIAGHGPADATSLLSDGAATPEMVEQVLASLPWRWNVFVAEDVPRSEAAVLPATPTQLREEASPYAALAGRGLDDVLAPARSLVSQARRRERRLFATRDARYRLADAASLAGDLDTCFRLHRARWGDDSPFAGAEEFHREFAVVAQSKGWLRLRFLEVDGAAVACWWGYDYGGVASYYQAGRDHAWDRFSVGTMLLIHSIREAHREGASVYRFLRGGESFKYAFATGDDPLVTSAWGRTGAARIGLALLRASPRAVQSRLLLRGGPATGQSGG
jgi:CelD/BcsL family acetyltransferase involved in cellulose biosynthesis